MYVEARNETYIAYMGKNADPFVTRYDHDTGRYDSVVSPGSTPVVNHGSHEAPSIQVDASGYVYVAFGCHNSELQVAVSDSPYDISSWTQYGLPDVPNGTYPSLAVDGDTVYIGYRTGGPDGHADDTYPAHEYATIIESTDRGATWTDLGPVIDTTGHPDAESDAYMHDADVHDGNVHLTWFVAHGSSHDGTRSDVYHAYYDPGSSSMKDLAGNDYGSTITWGEHDSGVLRAHSGSDIWGPRHAFDDDGSVYLTFGETGPDEQVFAEYDGGWSSEQVGSSRYGFGDVRIADDGTIEVHVSRRSDNEYWLYTRDGGVWSSTEIEGDVDIFNVNATYGAPDGKIETLAVEGDLSGPYSNSTRQVFAFGEANYLNALRFITDDPSEAPGDVEGFISDSTVTLTGGLKTAVPIDNAHSDQRGELVGDGTFEILDDGSRRVFFTGRIDDAADGDEFQVRVYVDDGSGFSSRRSEWTDSAGGTCNVRCGPATLDLETGDLVEFRINNPQSGDRTLNGSSLQTWGAVWEGPS